MKLSSLLKQREALLRQAHLANLAFAYQRLSEFAQRIAAGGLRGTVALKHAAPSAERYCASLTALEGRQSVIEEHFAEEDIMELADVIGFISCENDIDLTFRLEELGERFLAPLRLELDRLGVAIDLGPDALEQPEGDGPRGYRQSDRSG